MSEVRVVIKYDGETGFDVTLGGLTMEQADRVTDLVRELTEERFKRRGIR